MRAQKRLQKEAELKAIKRSKAREQKEKREKEKRQNLLQEVQVNFLSSEISISEDDGAGQLSNLRAIALIENETRRYGFNLKGKLVNIIIFPFLGRRKPRPRNVRGGTPLMAILRVSTH